ncbi:MAG: YabP/YqfC family sporulation protein [Oscillospiraceae bacterium]|nr:YabP/YqfC family sporulation protein [Oscillospiraceae bacterium]
MERKSILRRAADAFDIPADVGGGILHIEISGRQEVFVENHKGILMLSEEEVEISSGRGTVTVFGTKLSVLAMNTEEVRISGEIESIRFGE